MRGITQDAWCDHHDYYGHMQAMYTYRSAAPKEILNLTAAPKEAESLEQLRCLPRIQHSCRRN
ncbi:MAG: hypothetical protein U0Z17_10265 [Bacteroidales bacterium]